MDEDRIRAPPVRPARPDSLGPRSSGDFATHVTSAVPSPQYGKIRKRKSNINIRAVSQSQTKPSPQTGHKTARYSTGASTFDQDKKGSFRNAVRRLFGRKAKDGEAPVQRSPPRHGYHKSDPGNFPKPPPPTITEHPPEAIPQRTLSAPLHLIEPRQERQVRSPNALEFPKSARLKPLDLGNPFYVRPHQPKRRVTLPSLLLADREAAALGAAIAGYEARAAGMSFDVPRDVAEAEIGVAITSVTTNENRKSRSAHDLRSSANEPLTARKRSDEIRYWRDSYTGSVLLGSATRADEEDDDDDDGDDNGDDEGTDIKDVTPREATTAYPLSATTTATSRPSTSAGMPSSALFASSRPVTAGGETSRDLEMRVARLESSILEFQQSLEHLTQQSRSSPPRTPIQAPRAIRRQHTPSMLVDTLRHPSWRPAPLDDHERYYEDAGEVVEREWGSVNTSTRPNLPASSNDAIAAHRHESAAGIGAGNGGTFTALYNMLSEERSARRALENQVRHLQHEVSALVHPRAGNSSSWSSFPVPGPLLHHHRPRTPEESDRGASSRGGFSPSPQRVVSRFSATSAGTGESEGWRGQVGQEHDRMDVEEEVQTPYELFQTPLEESHPFSYSSGTLQRPVPAVAGRTAEAMF